MRDIDTSILIEPNNYNLHRSRLQSKGFKWL
jgi:hypothetical protein